MPGQLPRQGQRQKCRHRLSAHGRDIAQAARQAAVPNRLCRMPIPSKMNSLQREVSRDQRLVSGRQAQDCGIVPDSSHHALPRPYLAADPGNQRFFGKRHGETIYGPCLPASAPGKPTGRNYSESPDGYQLSNLSSVTCPTGHEFVTFLRNRLNVLGIVDTGNLVCYREHAVS